MKKLIVSALIVAGFAAAAFVMPDIEIKVQEKAAQACNDAGCSDG